MSLFSILLKFRLLEAFTSSFFEYHSIEITTAEFSLRVFDIKFLSSISGGIKAN